MKTVITAFSFLVLVCSGWSCSKDSGGNFSASANPAGQGGSLARFTIVGNYLYTVDKQNLKVFLISDAANPVLKNTVAAGFDRSRNADDRVGADLQSRFVRRLSFRPGRGWCQCDYGDSIRTGVRRCLRSADLARGIAVAGTVDQS